MIAEKTVYLNAEGTKAVPEGHKDARFLLVRKGHSIEQAELDKYDDAEKLIGKGGDEPELNPDAAGAVDGLEQANAEVSKDLQKKLPHSKKKK